MLYHLSGNSSGGRSTLNLSGIYPPDKLPIYHFTTPIFSTITKLVPVDAGIFAVPPLDIPIQSISGPL
jgi:hypothetical protein